MNAIVPADAPRLPVLQSGGSVKAIVPQDFEGAWRIATAVCKANMAPFGLETPEKAMVAILHGLEVGLTPMAALQSIAVVNGRPTIFGDGAIGLVRGSGKLEWIKERIEGDGDKMVAICEVKRKGEDSAIRGTFSVADAKLAKLWLKKSPKGGDTPWVTYPKRMLAMRARAFALRDGFADVLRGLGIKEEVEDFQENATGLRADLHQPPPAPPLPPAPPTIEHEGVEHRVDTPAEQADPETGEIIAEQVAEDEPSSDFFDRLEEALSLAADATQIEEIWTEFDALAYFEGKPNGEIDQGIATAIRRRHLKRVTAS